MRYLPLVTWLYFTAQGMTVAEYTALIPRDELHLVRGLIRRVVRSRGGWESSEHRALDEAWRRVLNSVRSPAGGSWVDYFALGDLDVDRLQRMSRCIDKEMLGGIIRKGLARQSEEKATTAEEEADEASSSAAVGGLGKGGQVPQGPRRLKRWGARLLLSFSVDDDDQGQNDWYVISLRFWGASHYSFSSVTLSVPFTSTLDTWPSTLGIGLPLPT